MRKEKNGHYIPSEFFHNEYNNEFFGQVFGKEQIWNRCGYDGVTEECTYDMVGAMFLHLFSNMPTNSVSSLNAPVADWRTNGTFRRFYQDEFIEKNFFEFDGLGRYGYVYYPNSCKKKACKIHMHLHGCTEIIRGLSYYAFTSYGLVQYAASNDIIVIFPQAENSIYPFNIAPCLASRYVLGEADEKAFLTKEGAQPAAMKRMLDRLIAPRDDATYDIDGSNILQYGFFEDAIEEWWVFLWDWGWISFRTFVFTFTGYARYSPWMRMY